MPQSNQHEALVKKWIERSTTVIQKVYGRINLINQKTNYHEKRIEKIENLLIRYEQRLDILKSSIGNLESDIKLIKLSSKQLNYFKFKALLIEKTPGGVWAWIIIDSLPAVVITLFIHDVAINYGYGALFKRIIDYMGFR